MIQTIIAILLDGNKPKPSVTNNIMALVEQAPQLKVCCVLGKHGFTNIRLQSVSKAKNTVVKILTLN